MSAELAPKPGSIESVLNDWNVNTVWHLAGKSANGTWVDSGRNYHFENVDISYSTQQFRASPCLFRIGLITLQKNKCKQETTNVVSGSLYFKMIQISYNVMKLGASFWSPYPVNNNCTEKHWFSAFEKNPTNRICRKVIMIIFFAYKGVISQHAMSAKTTVNGEYKLAIWQHFKFHVICCLD